MKNLQFILAKTANNFFLKPIAHQTMIHWRVITLLFILLLNVQRVQGTVSVWIYVNVQNSGSCSIFYPAIRGNYAATNLPPGGIYSNLYQGSFDTFYPQPPDPQPPTWVSVPLTARDAEGNGKVLGISPSSLLALEKYVTNAALNTQIFNVSIWDLNCGYGPVNDDNDFPPDSFPFDDFSSGGGFPGGGSSGGGGPFDNGGSPGGGGPFNYGDPSGGAPFNNGNSFGGGGGPFDNSNPSGGSNPFNSSPSGGGGFPCGMPIWQVSEPNISTWLLDEPLWYTPSLGSRIAFKIAYKQRETVAGFSTNIFSIGPKWNFSWLSYVIQDGRGSNTVFFPGGGSRAYGSGVDYLTETRLLGDMTNGYSLYYPDGSVDAYDFIFGNHTIAFRTQHINPQSQATTYNYTTDGVSVQLSTVVDASGGTNQIYYNVTNVPGTNLIGKITDAYGRMAHFSYDTNGTLTNVTDVGGISSSFSYDTNFWITSMQTPYGTTTFAMRDSSAGMIAPAGRSVLVTDPDGTSELYLGKDSAPGEPASYSSGEIPNTSSFSNLFDNNDLNLHDTYHWGKKQFENLSTTNISILTSNDFRLARMKHWLLSSEDQVGQTCNFSRSPSPDIYGTLAGQKTWYDYDGQTNSQFEGLQLLPHLTAYVLPDGTSAFTARVRNAIGNVTTNISTYSVGTSIHLRTNTYLYGTNLIDLVAASNALQVQVVSNVFNAYHEVVTNYNALNYQTLYTYDGNHRTASVTLPSGLVITNSYGNDGFLAQQIAVGFSTNGLSYTNGLILVHTNSLGLVTTSSWDNLQRLTGIIFPDGTAISNQYTRLDKTAFKDRLGHWIFYGYDALRRNTSITNALLNPTLFGYCSCGALESIQDALGNTVSYSFDNESRITEVSYPDGSSASYAYNLIGQMTNAADGAGVSVTNWYNNQKLAFVTSNAFGQIKSISYDILDRPTNMVDANGVALSMTYDNLNRLLSRHYPDGGVEYFGYSPAGLIAYTNQLSKATFFGYDVEGRKIAETNANMAVTRYGYDPAGDLISLTDPNGRVTQWGYDVFGRVTNKMDATSSTILKYGYDADNRVTNRWSAEKGNTIYSYDAVGNLLDVAYPMSSNLSFAYDAVNRLTNMTDGVGATSFTYTQTGQLASETGPWASDSVNYTYSDHLRTSLHLQQPNGSDWVQNYGYDAANRLQAIASPAGTFGYAYNPGLDGLETSSALVSKLALPTSSWITNTYDENGRMLGTYLYDPSFVDLDSTVYTYNVGNQRTSAERSGENTASYGYDPIGQVVSDTAAEVSGSTARMNEQLHYGFDAAGNLQYRTNNTLVQNFSVNALNELTTGTNGGRITLVGGTITAATSVTVNSSNALLYGDGSFAATNMPLASSYTAVANDSYGRNASTTINVTLATNTTFQYDANGNLTNDGLRNFAYDDENQLTQVWVSNQWKSVFTYDGKMRRRIRQEYTWSGSWVQTNAVYYVYDGNLVIQERDTNNLPAVTYTRGKDLSGSLEGAGGIGGLLARTASSATLPTVLTHAFYHADGNGNITALVNSSQAVVAKYLYDAFGNILAKSGPLADANLYRFSSKEAHLNSGLVYYLYRFYDANLQRWVNRDPLGEPGFEHLRKRRWEYIYPNRYLFVRNNPIKFFDSLGLQEADPEPGDPVNPPTKGAAGVGYNCLRLGDACNWFEPFERPPGYIPPGPYNPNAPSTPSPVVCLYSGPPDPPPPPVPLPPGSGCSTCNVNNPPSIPITSEGAGSIPPVSSLPPGTHF